MIYKAWPNLRYSVLGLKIAWRQEAHFRMHIVAAAIIIAAAFFLNVTALEFALLLLACGFVISIEILNTALEELCDKFTLEHDPHIGKIKDLAAAAVLVSSIFAALTGFLILGPYLYMYVVV
ncbi:MAG: diacylglycerol kinase [Minisyncoccia bacterium]